jgi:hypothetical protein
MRFPLLPQQLVVTALVAGGWCLAAASEISVTDPANCTIPTHITLVGSDGVSADHFGRFTVVIRDFTRNPMPGSLVDVSFAGCPYIEVCPNQLDPGIVGVDCARKVVTAQTGAGGLVTFAIIGAASPSPCPSDPPGCASMYGNGVFIGTASVAALDLDGAPGVNAGDLGEWLGNYFCGSNSARLDYNGDCTVNGDDLSEWLQAFFGGRSVSGCSSAACP